MPCRPAPPRRRTGTSGQCRPAAIPVCCGSSWTTRPTCAKTAGWGCAPATSSRCLASAASRWFTTSVTAPGRTFTPRPARGSAPHGTGCSTGPLPAPANRSSRYRSFPAASCKNITASAPTGSRWCPTPGSICSGWRRTRACLPSGRSCGGASITFPCPTCSKTKTFPGYCRRPAASRTPCLPLPAAATWPRRRANRGCSPRPTCSAWAMSRTARPRR